MAAKLDPAGLCGLRVSPLGTIPSRERRRLGGQLGGEN